MGVSVDANVDVAGIGVEEDVALVEAVGIGSSVGTQADMNIRSSASIKIIRFLVFPTW